MINDFGVFGSTANQFVMQKNLMIQMIQQQITQCETVTNGVIPQVNESMIHCWDRDATGPDGVGWNTGGEDTLASVAHVLEEYGGWIDKERVVGLGASYGGFTSNWLNGNAPRGLFNQLCAAALASRSFTACRLLATACGLAAADAADAAGRSAP